MIDTFGAAFGRLVKRKRAAKKMTQAQLACALYPNLAAEEAEKRKGDISKLENGKVPNPTTVTVQKLAQALDISDEDIDALQRRVQMSPSEKLDNFAILDRDALELLAGRFEIEKPHALSDAALRDLLTKKAEEYRALKSEVDAIDEGLKRLSNLKAAAQDAIARVDLEEVEELLSRVQEVELEEAAKTAELRANNALLRGKVEQAFNLLRAAADSFQVVQPNERITRILYRYCNTLRSHTLRYGGNGFQFTFELVQPLVSELAGHKNSNWTADALIWKALALKDQGSLISGENGTRLLAEAVAAYREVLTIYTKSDQPVHWAMTQNNLGEALRISGTRAAGEDGARLLAEAVTAYRNALAIYTKADHPVDWAMTQNNLGGALAEQATRTGGEDGTRLLAEAVTAYRDTLTIRTKADHPVQWAMTQENIALAEEAIADHEATDDPRAHLISGLGHADAALTVYDPEHMSYDYGTATRLRDRIKARLADLA